MASRPSLLILKWPATFRLELRNGRLISAQIDPAAKRERKIDPVSGNPVSGEHFPDRHRSKIGKEIGDEIAVHGVVTQRKQCVIASQRVARMRAR